jgi:hypothetical protein
MKKYVIMGLALSAVLASGALLNSSVAHAQVTPTADQIRSYMYSNCMGHGYGPGFCGCWVRTSLSLLKPEETFALLGIPGYQSWLQDIPYVDQQANGACAPYLARR